MLKRLITVAAVFGFMSLSAFAGPITYLVTVNTSSIHGTSGSLEFQFNPGASSQLADLQILNFTSNGTLVPPPVRTGDASGTLPGTLTFDNLTGFNDYFEDFTFGTTLSFLASFSGPALTSPTGTFPSDSKFVFSMFSDAAGTVPALTSNALGDALDISVLHTTGNTSVTNFSAFTTAPVFTPEPNSLLALTTGLLAVCFIVRRKA